MMEIMNQRIAIMNQRMVIMDPMMVIMNPMTVIMNPMMVIMNPMMVIMNPMMVIMNPMMVIMNPMMVIMNPIMVIMNPMMVIMNPMMVIMNPMMVIMNSDDGDHESDDGDHESDDGDHESDDGDHESDDGSISAYQWWWLMNPMMVIMNPSPEWVIMISDDGSIDCIQWWPDHESDRWWVHWEPDDGRSWRPLTGDHESDDGDQLHPMNWWSHESDDGDHESDKWWSWIRWWWSCAAVCHSKTTLDSEPARFLKFRSRVGANILQWRYSIALHRAYPSLHLIRGSTLGTRWLSNIKTDGSESNRQLQLWTGVRRDQLMVITINSTVFKDGLGIYESNKMPGCHLANAWRSLFMKHDSSVAVLWIAMMKHHEFDSFMIMNPMMVIMNPMIVIMNPMMVIMNPMMVIMNSIDGDHESNDGDHEFRWWWSWIRWWFPIDEFYTPGIELNG